jgi:hypothetical protein
VNRNNATCRAILLAAAVICATVAAGAFAQSPQDPCRPTDLVCKGSLGGLNSIGSSNDKTAAKSVSGFIWLGNLQKDRSITSPTVNILPNDQPLTLDKLKSNTSLTVSNPVYIREFQPENDTKYFNGQKIVGVLEVDDKVVLLEEPVVIVRQSGLSQIWARIRHDIAPSR